MKQIWMSVVKFHFSCGVCATKVRVRKFWENDKFHIEVRPCKHCLDEAKFQGELRRDKALAKAAGRKEKK